METKCSVPKYNKTKSSIIEAHPLTFKIHSFFSEILDLKLDSNLFNLVSRS